MAEAPLEETLRRVLREEVGSRFDAVGEQLGSLESRLGSLEKRVTDGFSRMDERFAWTEEQFEWVSQRFDAVDEQFAELKKALEGVIDEKFPPVDQQQSGGPASRVAIAAKGGA